MRKVYSPTDVCSVEGCERRPQARGLCSTHYHAWYLGRKLKPIRPDLPPEERFWAKVNKDGPTQPHMDTPCWAWTAATHEGYGVFIVPGSEEYREQRAHRLSWTLANGPIPEGLQVLHRCDNPACVRVDHLFLGTHTDNMRDMVAKNRHAMQVRPKVKSAG
jgi:hypothetical protein